MEWILSEIGQQYVEGVELFAKKELTYDPRPYQTTGVINKEAWKKCAEHGILGGLVPEKYGGLDLEFSAYVASMETLGRHCLDSGLIFAISAHVYACTMPLLHFGSQEQKEKWLPKFCDGSAIAGIAIAEDKSASNAFLMETIAVKSEIGLELNGEKAYVTNGPYCDIVFAYASMANDPSNIVVCIVERGIPGVHFMDPIPTLGLRSAPVGRVIFNGCEVLSENILSKKDNGKLIFMNAMEWERGCILAPTVGTMQRQLEGCIQYLKTRKQGDLPIAKKQVLAHRVVEMRMRVALSELILQNFVMKKDKLRRANVEASMAKLYISEAFIQNSLDAMQLHGALGYTECFEYESNLRDSLGYRLASGTSDIQREIIAHWMKLL